MSGFAKTLLAASALAAPVGLVTTVAVVPTTASAQDLTSGAIAGQVKDAAGNPVAGVAVRITSARGYDRTVTTGANGDFRVNSTPIGTYTISASKDGFGTATNRGVAVSIGATAGVDIQLKSGGVASEEVVVTAARQRAVDFSENSTGITVDVQETFDLLPIGRSSEAVQLLAPTATVGDNAFGSTVSLGGASVAENIFYVNGMNITNFRTFVGGSTIPFEAYDQLQVKTGGYSAEYGRATGGAVIAATRSGSNDLHGGVNLFSTPDGLRETAKNTFQSLNELDERSNNEMNVWLSGPIIKDRLFFFGFYNARDTRFFDVTAAQSAVGGPRASPTAIETTDKSPYFGGKLDWNIIDGHRLEFTYLSDEATQNDTQYRTVGGVLTPTGTARSEIGGLTKIGKYTGDFTDWFTLSVLYGQTTYNRTSLSDLDTEAAVFANLGSNGLPTFTSPGSPGTIVRGNPNLLVESGQDERKLFRADADFYFTLFGDHHLRVGYDQEKLNATATTFYSGGTYYRYYRAGASGALAGLIAPNTNYVRVRQFNSGGEFDSENTAIYVQDDWSVTDRLTLNLGVRTEDFINNNASGRSFTEIKDQVAARVGATYDLFGDRRTKLSAFYGKYYLPVAANTNIRLAGNERFTQDWYLFSAINPTTLVPTLSGSAVLQEVLSDSNNANPATLTASNLEPQFQDEYIIGIEHQFENNWKVGFNAVRRELKSVLEDFDMSYIQDNFCASSARPSSLTLADCQNGHFGGGGDYVLINPGKSIPTAFERPDGSLVNVVVPASIADLPKAVREFTSLEFSFERPFDGKWGLSGSYVWSKSEGNYEGGVKSDNGQDDTGLTQDFDEPGWMDGAFGPLPNDRTHTFKLYGTYAPMKNMTIGGNLFVQSGRKFGCIGVYPGTDGRASTSSAASWYCGGRLTPRGSQFEGDWVTRFDVNAVYSVPLELGEVDFRVDVFNIFNLDTPVDYRELGEDDGGTADPFYRAPTSYQAPRSIRLGLSYKF